jgi:hypothetical protein
MSKEIVGIPGYNPSNDNPDGVEVVGIEFGQFAQAPIELVRDGRKGTVPSGPGMDCDD